MAIPLKKLLQSLGLWAPISKTYWKLNWKLTRARYYGSYYALTLLDATARGLPVPPAQLITLVAGNADVGWFLLSGKRASKSLLDTLKMNQVSVESLESILDFGCGCGRVLRNLGSLKHAKLCGADYNPDLVNWCDHNIPFARFQTNRLSPPLDYGDQTFDLVYAFSVFTHLPEPLQLSWMNELLRVLKPGGYLLISTHGEF